MKSIVLVDDDTTFTEIMARNLRRQAYTVFTAADADSACSLAEIEQPELILLDLNLPGDSGLLALPRLLERAPAAKIVILTGYSSIATAVKAMKMGALDYLCKPATLAEILAAFEGQAKQLADNVPESPLSVDRLEWEHIQKVLAQNEGNVSATAKALGMHRRTLQRKLKKRPVRQ